MKKLELNPEELVVESFHAEDVPEAARGTVRGQAWTYDPQECTCWGRMCGTSAAPGEPCVCRTASYVDSCSSFVNAETQVC